MTLYWLSAYNKTSVRCDTRESLPASRHVLEVFESYRHNVIHSFRHSYL